MNDFTRRTRNVAPVTVPLFTYTAPAAPAAAPSVAEVGAELLPWAVYGLRVAARTGSPVAAGLLARIDAGDFAVFNVIPDDVDGGDVQ